MYLRQLYPEVDPYEVGMLEVGDGHFIYYERVGTRGAKPAVFLHGGPGAGCNSDHRRLFDPSRYDVLLFDQRGCGRSRPYLQLKANTTSHIIMDIEMLRTLTGAPTWLVLGGSWGSSLALAYAQLHPERVSELLLRGIYTWTREEAVWYYQSGVSDFYPEEWDQYQAFIPKAERSDMIGAYYRRLIGEDDEVRLAAAKAWTAWEDRTISLLPPPKEVVQQANMASAVLEAHYLVNAAWLEEGQLIRDAVRLRSIPGVIVQGRYDMPCRPRYAYALHKAWPRSVLHIIEGSGHVASEPAILDTLIRATDAFASIPTACVT